MTNPTVVDTRQAVASGQISHFIIGIANYKYPASARQFGLAAPLLFSERETEVSIPREIPKPNHWDPPKPKSHWAELIHDDLGGDLLALLSWKSANFLDG